MPTIPITRSLFLLPFVGILDEIGAPSSSLLEKFRLPLNLNDKSNSYIPLLPALSFVESAQKTQDLQDFSFLAGQRLHFSHLRERTKALVAHSPTLLVALRHACHWASREDSMLNMWIEYDQDQDQIRVCNRINVPGSHSYLKHAQWLQNVFCVYIARQFTGADWMPPTMAFEARYTPNAATQSCWPNVQFLSEQRTSWISIPNAYLSLPYHANTLYSSCHAHEDDPSGYEIVETLKLMLPSYLDGGVPTLTEVAEMAGVSPRTFQRKLSSVDFAYSDILDNVRFERSSTLLRETDAKIIDVAFASGYSDPAHFSRAFRRITGVTPRQFRVQSQLF